MTPYSTVQDLAEIILEEVAGLRSPRPQGQKKTPARFVRALEEITTPEVFDFTTFDTTHDEMIIERNIKFASLCEHHVLPFMGICHIGYVPDGRLAGLSKLARYVRYCAAGLRTQEDLTADIADGLVNELQPKGVAVIMEAEHTCMTIRGALSPGTRTYTACMRGVYADHDKTAKAEFLSRTNGSQ